MKRKIIFLTVIICILLTGNIYASERISKQELDKSSYSGMKEESMQNKILLLSDSEEDLTVAKTWDISATENDNVTATLYENGLLKITGSGEMKNFSTINIEDREYSPWYEDRNNIINVQIENEINNIGNAAFFDCRQLIKITIPDGLKTIGEYAFRYCNSLTKIVLPESVNNIGNNAFTDCTKLANINIPSKVTEISRGLFYNCKSIVNINIPEGVTIIGRSSFGNCDILTDIKIPANVKTIEESVFFGCYNLESIDVDEKNSCFVDVEGVLLNKDKTELICYPSNKSGREYIIPETVETIKAYSISLCKNLENVVVQEGTKNIEGINFHYCSNLKSITISETVTNIKGKILSNCTSLEKVNAYCNSYAEKYVTENYSDKLNILHKEIIDEEVKPTCTETGLTEGKHCSVCNAILVTQQEIPALGHNFGTWIIDKEATYEEEGHKYRICINCNKERQEEVIPKLTKEELQVTTKYIVKEKDNVKYIMITSGSTVNKIIENITSNKEIKVVDKAGKDLTGNDLVGTGAKVVVKEDNKEVYTVVVKGDANGDGKIEFINDIIRFNNYRLNLIKLDISSILAGDIDDNENIDFINDIIRINNYRLGRINSL